MKFVAHRGYSAEYTANTLIAFEAVLKHPECGNKITGIELDIRLTGDGTNVVFHDGKIRSGGIETVVEKISYQELVTATHEHFNGNKPPCFDEVLQLVKHQLPLLVEIKDGGYNKAKLMDSLEISFENYKPAGDIILHSFSPEIMRMAMAHFKGPEIRFGTLIGNPADLDKFGKESLAKMDFIHPSWNTLVKHEELFAVLKKPMHVWTVNKPEDLAKLKKLRHPEMIAAVMTDDLKLLECD